MRSRGSYQYYLNDEPAPVEEAWLRRGEPDGGWVIESERRAPGVVLQVVVHGHSDALEECDIEWTPDDAAAVHCAYRLRTRGDCVWERTVEGRPDTDGVLAAPAAVFYPLMRVFTGPVIARLLMQGEGDVVIPDITDPQGESLLLPQRRHRSARELAKETIRLGAVEYEARACQFMGDQYGPDARFWLDEDDLLLRYTWPQAPGQDWCVELVE